MSNERSQSGVFVVLGVIVLLIAGLGYKVLHKHALPAEIPAPDADPPQASDSTTINFYLDGSGSIKHFLTTTTDADGHPLKNYMQEFLDKAGTTLSNPPGEVGWKGKVNFLKFGDRVNTIPDGDPHSMSRDPSNFNEGNTSIEVPIKDQRQGEGDDLKPEVKVIVTDLYENGGRIEKPANALAQKYLSIESDPAGANAVDILAVRNPHDGDVEDMPGAGKATLHGAANSMPFYVIVAGPTADVRHVMKVLLAGTGLDDAKKNNKATEFLFTRTPLPRRTDVMKPGGAGRFAGTDTYSTRNIPFMQLRSGMMEMSWNESVKPLPGVVNLYGKPEGQQLKVTVLVPPQAKAATAASGDAAAPPKWVEFPDGAVAIDDCSAPELLCKRIDRSKLPQGPGTYVLRFDRVVAERTAVLDPDSPELRKWNIEEADAEAIGRTPQKMNPHFDNQMGLTPDLSKFLNALQGQMFRAPVPVTTYYVYVQTE